MLEQLPVPDWHRRAFPAVGFHCDISRTLAGTTSSASVAATTCAVDTPGPGLPQGCAAVAKLDDRQLGDYHVDRARRRDRQGAFFHDFRLALGGVLHRDDEALGAGDEVHGAAHAGHHLVGDSPVGEPPGLVDLQAAEHREVEMATADEAE